MLVARTVRAVRHPLGILPEIKPSAALNLQLNNGLALQASVGDQSAALIAGIDTDSADALVNLGTGGFVVRYLPEGKTATDGYLRTLVYQDSGLHVHLAIEGTLNSTAAALAPYPVAECSPEDLAMGGMTRRCEASGAGMSSYRLLPQSAGCASNVSEADDIFCLAEPSGLGHRICIVVSACAFRNQSNICRQPYCRAVAGSGDLSRGADTGRFSPRFCA